MKKLWKDIKDEVDFVKDISVEKDCCDSEGYCQVYITNGKYKGLYVVGRIIFGKDSTELVIDDEQTVYDPLEK